jgi:hypothetical protein
MFLRASAYPSHYLEGPTCQPSPPPPTHGPHARHGRAHVRTNPDHYPRAQSLLKPPPICLTISPTRRHPSSLSLVRHSFSELLEDRSRSPCPRARSAITVGASSCLSPQWVPPRCPQLETRLILLSPSLVPSARAHKSFPRASRKTPPSTQDLTVSLLPFKGPGVFSRGKQPRPAPIFSIVCPRSCAIARRSSVAPPSTASMWTAPSNAFVPVLCP